MALAIITVALTVITLTYVVLLTGRRAKHLPPGPPTLPLIGNLHQIPTERTYLRLKEWSDQYGPIYSLKLAHHTLIVITDRRLVKEVMDKRSSVTSGRPKAYIADQLLYEGDDIILMQDSNPHWKVARRFMHQNFMGSKVENVHMPLLNAETTQMIRDMLIAPKDFMKHPKRFANSFMMSIAYGIRTPHVDVDHMVRISAVLANTTTILQPGTLPPADLFPFLLYLPQGLFGNWRDKIAETRRTMSQLYSECLEHVAKRQKEGGIMESFADRLLQDEEQSTWTWHARSYMAGLMMEAGSDTTSSALVTFILLMTKSPDAYRKAQAQIDAVIGDERSPRWEDFERLPAVNCLVKETMRIRPVAPIGFPHALSEDVWIDGMLLPKGSDIIVNVLGLHFDEKKFPNPDEFQCDRFIDKPGLASEYANIADYESRDHYAYGTGRRLCPGIHLADRAVFVGIAKLLWAFDILPAKDKAGNDIPVDTTFEKGFEGGIILSALPFPCELRPRSETRRQIVFREFAEAERTVFPKYLVPNK